MYEIRTITDSFVNATPFPPILFRILTIIREHTTSSTTLTKEISKDPVLVAKILASANSGYFGSRQKISDIAHAIPLLGVNNVSMIVLRSLGKSLFRTIKSDIYPSGEIWLHSIKVAHLSRILVRNNSLPYIIDMYTAGLLHDIGKLAIFPFLKPGDKMKLAAYLHSGLELYESERLVLGFDHAQVSFEILNKVKLPFNLIKSVYEHHNRMDKAFHNLSFILSLANILANFDKAGINEELNEKLFTHFKITADDINGLSDIFNELNSEIKHL